MLIEPSPLPARLVTDAVARGYQAFNKLDLITATEPRLASAKLDGHDCSHIPQICLTAPVRHTSCMRLVVSLVRISCEVWR